MLHILDQTLTLFLITRVVTNLDYQFDPYTEKFASKELERIRTFASTCPYLHRATVEVGSNRGRFLNQLAARNPEGYFLGIEWRRRYVELARKDAAKAGLKNVFFLDADANHALPILFDDGQLSCIYALYPDPWWKKRQRKRRLIQPKFLDLLSTKMELHAKLFVRTDVGPLADDMHAELRTHPHFEPLPFAQYPLHPFSRSTRERSTISRRFPVHLVYYQKASPELATLSV